MSVKEEILKKAIDFSEFEFSFSSDDDNFKYKQWDYQQVNKSNRKIPAEFRENTFLCPVPENSELEGNEHNSGTEVTNHLHSLLDDVKFEDIQDSQGATKKETGERDMFELWDGKASKCFKYCCPLFPLFNDLKECNRISYFYQLNTQPIIPKDRMFEVTIEHVNHPGKFFIAVDTVWNCDCNRQKKDVTPRQMSRKQRLERDLTIYLLSGFRHMKTRFWNYAEGQLVAVKRIVDNQIVFSRAVVLYDTIDVVDFQKPCVHIQLLDNGAKMIAKFGDLCNLPVDYVSSLEPLAVQCTLHGISPISDKWTSEAKSYFKSVIRGRKCILKVINSAMGDDSTRIFYRENPYEVELLILLADPVTGEEKYQNIAEFLASQFYGVLWSLSSPFSPSLNQLVSSNTLPFFRSDIRYSNELQLIPKNKKASKK